MAFDDDDLEDYSNYSGDEFHEDNLDDEEYTRLYDQLPGLKQALVDYNDTVPEEALKEALFYNYYEIPEAVQEIKEKYPKKKEPSGASKLSALARARAQRHSPESNSSSGGLKGVSALNGLKGTSALRSSSTSSSGSKSESGGSKLALLAKSRKSGLAGIHGAIGSSNKSVSILDKISKKVGETPDEATNAECIRSSQPRIPDDIPNIPDISNKRKRPRRVLKLSPTLSTPAVTSMNTESASISPDSITNIVYSVDSNIPLASLDKSLLRESSNLASFMFGNEFKQEQSSKRRRLAKDHHSIFEPITNNIAKKIVDNFKEMSPDGKIEETQKELFNAKLGDLSLNSSSSNVTQKNVVPKKTKPFKKIDVAKHSMETHKKPHKSFVMIGHVDAGKSTVLGRLLYDVGSVDAKTLTKLTREAEKAGKGSFALAWILDQTTEERSRGVTVDTVATNFETDHTRYTAIDAPGHRDFVPQMINGVAQANYALIVVDCVTGEFESGLADGQTKEHTLLAKNLGIGNICVLVNKMDRENWSQERFDEIVDQMTLHLTQVVGFEKHQIEFIPLSGLSGQNLVKKNPKGTEEITWYKGPTVIEYLDNLPVKEDANIDEEGFMLSINDIFEPTNSELQISGKVLTGTIQPGETIQISPSKEYLQVQSVYVNDNQVNIAFSNDLALLKFKTAQLENKAPISKGDMVLALDLDLVASDIIIAEISLFEMNKPLLVGTPFLLFKNNSHCSARITNIILINGAKKKKKHLVSKQTAVVEINSERPLVSTTYEENEILGRIVLRREGASIGAGKIIKIESK